MKHFFLLLLILMSGALGVSAISFNDDVPPEELAENILNAMTDEEALAQVFMFGWKEWMTGPEPAITEWISRRALGGVKVFGWNTEDKQRPVNTERLASTIGGFQRLALRGRFNIPLLVATDQEGGPVRHVKGQTSKAPGAMAAGASGYPQDAYLSGYYIGRELAVLGINMNFAPTVDLFTNHDTMIGARSFGDDPVKAGLLGIAFAKGLEAAGVIPTAKHFPGHGDTPLDSHKFLPKINIDFDTLWERELVPYRMLAKEGVPAIMSGHLAFPKTEANETPASQSRWFLEDVLRGKTGFKGLIITDDLAMDGATMSAGSLSRAAKAAFLAGNNIVMMSQTPAMDEAIWVNLLRDMGTDKEFRSRVRESARRVLIVKLKYLKGEKAVPLIPNPERVREELPDAEGAKFFTDLAVRAVTLVKNERNVIPLKSSQTESLLFVGDTKEFFKLRDTAYAGASGYGDSTVSAGLMSRAAAAGTIVFYLNKDAGLDTLRAFRPLGKRIVVISALSPSRLERMDWVDAVIAVYSDTYESLAAGFSVMAGKLEARGSIPYKVK
jgi:beta-N-acetylhexosaminidase